MKIIVLILTSLLLASFPFSQALAASCEITAYGYSMPAKDAAEFTLAYNPAGQADSSLVQINTWVEQKRAVALGTVVIKSESGVRESASGAKFSLETEATASPDASVLNIIFRAKFADQTMTSSVVSNNNAFAFAGNSTLSSPADSSATVYFVYLLARASK